MGVRGSWRVSAGRAGLARHAVAEVDDARAEGAGLDEFEYPALALGKERGPTADQHRGTMRHRSASGVVMERPPALLLMTAMTVTLVACVACVAVPTGGVPSGTSPIPSFTDSPSPTSERLTEADLKYRLTDAFGDLWYCDPDEYPVARDDETELAAQRFDEIRDDAETFAAIVRHLGLQGRSSFEPSDQLAIYRDWKALNAIGLEPGEDGSFRFDYLAQPTSGDLGTRSTGSIHAAGSIDVDRQEAAGAPACPICLARGTPIQTPRGPIAIEDLVVGDLVLSPDAAGRYVPALIVRIGSMPAPPEHRVVQLQLSDGRHLTASPGHPLPDGRRLGDLRVGDRVDGAEVISARTTVYRGGSTFDLLAAGPTGGYLAGGIPLGSTLTR